MAQPYIDFIPEGNDTGGLGKGFTDFVPAKETPVAPEVEKETEVKAESPVVEEPKKPVKSKK